MAAAFIPAPGTIDRDGNQLGPCVEECEHTYCVSLRDQANSDCRYCTEPIGWEVGFFDLGFGDDRTIVHARCEYARVDAEIASR